MGSRRIVETVIVSVSPSVRFPANPAAQARSGMAEAGGSTGRKRPPGRPPVPSSRRTICCPRKSVRGGLGSGCGLFDLRLQVLDVEAGPSLHRWVLDEGRDVLSDDLARDLETPHLVLEHVPIGDGPFRKL